MILYQIWGKRTYVRAVSVKAKMSIAYGLIIPQFDKKVVSYFEKVKRKVEFFNKESKKLGIKQELRLL